MSYLLTKLLPLFVYPLGLALVFGIVGLLLLFVGRRKMAGFLAIVSLSTLWVSSTPIFSDYVLAPLEQRFPMSAMRDIQPADAMVVMGGGVRRLVYTAQLFKSRKSPVLILAGGGVTEAISEAEMMKGMLMELGVPEQNMLLEANSRNTYQNARNATAILKEKGIQRILLVTSALHMRRAKAVFETMGIAVIPAATDYHVGWLSGTILDWMPASQVLERTTQGVKEYIGWWVYSFKGWV